MLTELKKELNKEQYEALQANGHTLITACPGSGKTHFLTTKAAYLHETQPDAVITLVTFTRDSANEMAERIKKRIGKNTKRIFCGTFHQLALMQLKPKDKNILRRLMTEADKHYIIQKIKDNMGLFDIQDEEIRYGIERNKTLLDHTDTKKTIDYSFYLEFVKQQKILNKVDFSDIIRDAVLYLKSGEIEPIKCTHLFVDEFQDVDPIQIEWIKCQVEKQNTKVTAVGDDDQSIYGFRFSEGCVAFNTFISDFKPEQIAFLRNYRSRSEILATAEKVIKNNKKRIAKPSMISEKGRNGVVTIHKSAERFEEAEYVADIVASAPSKWAVLARTKRLLEGVKIRFDIDRIPHYYMGRSIYDSKPVRLMFDFLIGLEAGDRHIHDVILSNITKKSIKHVKYIESTKSKDLFDLVSQTETMEELFAQTLKQNRGDDINFLEKLYQYSQRLSRWNRMKKKQDVNLMIFDVADYLGSNSDSDGADSLYNNMAQLLVSVRDVSRIKDKISYIERMQREQQKQKQGVALMTMHGSKGLEFDCVCIIGCEEGVCPSNKVVTKEDIEEERNLFYVGMTRAKDFLTLSFVGKKNKTENYTPSRFLVEAELLNPDLDIDMFY